MAVRRGVRVLVREAVGEIETARLKEMAAASVEAASSPFTPVKPPCFKKMRIVFSISQLIARVEAFFLLACHGHCIMKGSRFGKDPSGGKATMSSAWLQITHILKRRHELE
jgi:hypothetical protein